MATKQKSNNGTDKGHSKPALTSAEQDQIRRAKKVKVRATRGMHGETMMAGIIADRKAAREAAIEAAQDRQAELALGSPFIVNDRKSGGVEGLAREIATEIIEIWRNCREVAQELGMARMAYAIESAEISVRSLVLVNELEKLNGTGAAGDVKLGIQKSVTDRVKRTMPIAVRASRDALKYGFNKAKTMSHT